MDDTTLAALTKAATDARIVDASAITHPLFADILAKIKTADDVPAALLAMQKLKPAWFERYENMSETRFNEQEGVLGRTASRAVEHPQKAELGELFKSIDAGRLSDDDYHTFENAWLAFMATDYSRIDVPKLRALVARTKAA